MSWCISRIKKASYLWLTAWTAHAVEPQTFNLWVQGSRPCSGVTGYESWGFTFRKQLFHAHIYIKINHFMKYKFKKTKVDPLPKSRISLNLWIVMKKMMSCSNISFMRNVEKCWVPDPLDKRKQLSLLPYVSF